MGQYWLNNVYVQRMVVLAEGGRYDDMISRLELEQSTKRLAVGVRFYLNRVLLCKNVIESPSAVDVLVCSPSESDYVAPYNEIRETAHMLRGQNVSVETICPPLASADTLVEYCKQRGIAFMVCPRNSSYRIKELPSGKNLPELKIDDLVTFITTRKNK